MEFMLLSALMVLCWVPSAILLVAGLLSFRLKQTRKVLLRLSAVSFSIPFILILGTRVNALYQEKSFEGTYLGKDSHSNPVIVEISKKGRFTISIENLKQDTIKGSWHYSRDYDAYLFSAENHSVSINENGQGELTLNSDIKTDCCEIDNITLQEE
ncbi:hypothetical protein QNI19_37465 [Cytophagaceae bacterium DM2B3-1]|uniref:Uncharacterized protein n=1 Tax=Xanthocytophaga flava TaxID=3048013 RepID=A0ABT7D0J2_9BACT|nr:hypothetical protein [Xanthocytophaga flavus]MDJ1473786.1 hypothetical protein [Xanthocytophaga flavus]MDJ1498682.1 hypothetical protein [Xanthocytophaga flavus]